MITSDRAVRRSLVARKRPGRVAPPLSVPVRRARVKGLVDVVAATALVLLLMPAMVVIAVAIKLDSRGPVLFVQERFGVRRRRVGRWVVHEPATFKLFKFRSMTVGADPSVHEAHIQRYLLGEVTDGDPGARFKLTRDPRVTRIGRIIRRASLDELPQLFNVLRRDMSLVGPRPVPEYEALHYLEHAPQRFGALPGITGLWQVSGRCDLGVAEMLELDLRYVESQSFGLDAKVLLKTIPAIFTGKGAA